MEQQPWLEQILQEVEEEGEGEREGEGGGGGEGSLKVYSLESVPSRMFSSLCPTYMLIISGPFTL